MISSIEEMIVPYVGKDPTKFCSYEEFEEGISTLKEFCPLRANSISIPLDGIIPSTAGGQTQNNSSLLDTSDITISVMGSMRPMGK